MVNSVCAFIRKKKKKKNNNNMQTNDVFVVDFVYKHSRESGCRWPSSHRLFVTSEPHTAWIRVPIEAMPFMRTLPVELRFAVGSTQRPFMRALPVELRFADGSTQINVPSLIRSVTSSI